MEYLIVGASAAGLSAAETLCRVDPKGHITILCQERNPYSRVLLPHLLAGTVRKETALLPVPKGAELIGERKVVEIDPQKKEVITASGEIFHFDKLLIASGAFAIRPQIMGADKPFVFTVREMSDIQKIQTFAKKGGRAIVVGAGPVGIRIVEALYSLGMRVTLIEMASSILPRMLDRPAAAIVEGVLIQRGIEIIKGDKVMQIAEDGVHLESGERRACDIVILAVGVRPNVAFLKGNGIKIHHGIIVDEYQATSVVDIYAAGDVAETRDVVYEERRVNALWSLAKEQGHIAGLNMASYPTRYIGSIARNTLQVFNLSVFTFGMSREEGLMVFREQGRDFYRKLVLKEGILKGATFIGKVRGGGLYFSMARRGQEISYFVDRLIKRSFNFPSLLYYYRWQSPLEEDTFEGKSENKVNPQAKTPIYRGLNG